MLTIIQKFVPSSRSSPSEFASSLQMKTILYVEDDEHDLFFLTRAFKTQAPDLRVENVTSVADAIEYLSGQSGSRAQKKLSSPDLILSDVTIPGGSGFELVRWIRANPQLGKTPIILLTGTAQELQVEKAQASGADFCLEKSTNFEALLSKIRKLLDLD